MVARELVQALIKDYSPASFAAVIKAACAPATFVPVSGQTLKEKNLPVVNILGVVKDLPGEANLAAPLLVADIPLGEKPLTERSSRILQFKVARKALERVCVNPPVPVAGIIVQGVFAFHDKQGAFRVSLVTAKAENGKLVWSQVKRQSFYVTPDPDRNATFIQRMTANWSSLAAIKEAFSVEKLTKEFYSQLFKWYDRACNDKRVEYPNDVATDNDNRDDKNRKHLLRLITRLMFVWFLKQKGLVPSKLFDEGELKNLLKNFDPVGKSQHQYYRAILQNLFFATLNSEIDERGFAETPTPNRRGEKPTTKHHGVKTKYRYIEEFTVSRKEVVELFHRIPFLNGGLFECLDQEGEDGKVLYYDGFSLQEFHRDRHTLTWAHVPNDLFFDPEYGIIPLLKRYNFTVEENTPGDEDVALDPELLGKVFENLLGAYNPETEEVVRKSTGSFYTPREIVNYMVDESLIAYLESKLKVEERNVSVGRDGVPSPSAIRLLVKEGVRPADQALCRRLIEAIENAKILDPACGSGAFPMGALLEMAELLRILKKLPEDANLYDLKLKLIENCIFGVDIQEIAVQISKLRFFISLVCEQKPDWSKPNYGINTLPNLETKFVAANSLIGLKRTDTKQSDSIDDAAQSCQQLDLFGDASDILQIKNELWDVRHKHFLAKTRKEKNALRKEDKELRTKLAKRGKELGYADGATRLMASWDPYNQNVHAEFFDPAWMFNVKDGFDVVIGNPPYGLINKRQNKGLSIIVDDDVFEAYKNDPAYLPAQTRGINIYRLFVLKSMYLLSHGGIFCEIFPLAYAGDLSASPLRSFVFENYNTLLFDAFPERDDERKRVFEAVKMSVCILTMANEKSDSTFEVRIHSDKDLSVKCKSVMLSPDLIRSIDPANMTIPLVSQQEMNTLARICQNAKPLKTYARCATGELDMTFAKSVFTHDVNNPTMHRGAAIGRYLIHEQMSQGEKLYVDEAKLKVLRPKLIERKKLERVALQGITGVNELIRLKATLIKDAYCANSVNYIENKLAHLSNRYLLGLINSKLLNFYFTKFSTNSNVNGYEIDNLPIYRGSADEQENISKLVSDVLSAKEANSLANTTKLEQEIDEIVYDLYGLTAEERAIVEKSCEKPEKAANTIGEGAGSGAPGGRALPVKAAKGKKTKTPRFDEEF